jgi:TonB family protein
MGPGVIAPELLPFSSPTIPAEKCKKKVDGRVVVSVIVDATGHARNIMFLQPLGSDLDKFALQIAAEDRFKPATSDNNPVAVAQSLTIDLQACIDQSKDAAGKKISLMRLRSTPVQKSQDLPQPPEEAVLISDDSTRNDSSSGNFRTERVGGGVSAPRVLNGVEAEFTDAARRKKYQGVCLLTLIVDRNGMPLNVTVIRGLDYGLSDNAIVAVNKYRFKPAMRNGEPVPVKITVEVNFRLY